MKKISFWVFLAMVYIGMSAARCTPEPDPIPEPDTIVDNGTEEKDTITNSTPANHLVAYFPFDNNANPTVGVGITYDTKGSNASFVKGKVGNAYQGAATDAYLAYNLAQSNVFSSLKSFTIAAWIKTSATSVAAAPIVMVNGDVIDHGSLSLVLESNSDADGLDLKGYFADKNTGMRDLRFKSPLFLVNKWIYVSYTYNEDNSTIALYVNGQLVKESKMYAEYLTDVPEENWPALGALALKPGNKMFIGAWERAIGASEYPEPWMTFYPGLLDELRIYDKALSTTEIATLYSEEQAKTTEEPEDTKKEDPSNIAASNLIAYFPFEGNGNDAVGGLTPRQSSIVTFPTGRTGKGYQGANDAYLLYDLPASSKLKSLKAFSIALWVKMVPNTVETTDAPEQMIFQMDGETDWVWGNFFFLQHRNWPEGETTQAKDYAEMGCYFWKNDAEAGLNRQGQRGNGWFQNVKSNKWVHLICTYDNVTSEFHAYAGGVHVTDFDGTEYTGIKRWQDMEYSNPFGDLKFNTPTTFAIGAWVAKAKGEDLLEDAWASSFKGQIDEFRIYDRALTANEVKDLYRAEVSQIND